MLGSSAKNNQATDCLSADAWFAAKGMIRLTQETYSLVTIQLNTRSGKRICFVLSLIFLY